MIFDFPAIKFRFNLKEEQTFQAASNIMKKGINTI